MAALVLESTLGSQYDDSPTSYEFPTRYLRHLDGAGDAAPVLVVIYEPRGNGSGRMAYVGWATISRAPEPTHAKSRQGSQLWRVQYDRPVEVFENPVPREILGEPLEGWLEGIERGRQRNVATFGRAVRPLADEDLQRILELGNARVLDAASYPIGAEHVEPAAMVAERSRRLVETLVREASFRDRILSIYDYRCAVSGFDLGSISRTKATGVIDAAHIRPVSRGGSDQVTNGLPLTPTLHRLFDAGLFTIAYESDRPSVRVSPRLEASMIRAPDRDFRLELRDGLPLLLPRDGALWPHPDQLRFHEREVFRAD